MLYRFLTPVLILAILGCDSKEYKKSSNPNIDLVSELNSGNPEVVISKLESKNSLSPREQYYLASAYSSQGGVDVFSLYSVLELQLFRKNALEWSDLSKEQNPYLRFMKAQEGVDKEARKKKRADRWSHYEGQIISSKGFKLEKPTAEAIRLKDDYVRNIIKDEVYNQLDERLAKRFKSVMALPQDLDQRIEAWEAAMEEEIYSHKDTNSLQLYFYADLGSHYGDRVQFETMKANYLKPEDSKNVFGNVKWEMLYMNILWNTYEAIPIMKQMPSLTEAQQESVTRALEEYRKLLKNPEFQKVAIKNLGVLVGVSLLSIYKDSFDFEEVQDAQDLVCTFQANALVSNYGLIRKRVIFLAEILEESDEIEEFKEYKAQLKAFKDSIPETLSLEQSERYYQNVEEFRLRSCFSN